MVYLNYITCLRYTILVRNPRYADSDVNENICDMLTMALTLMVMITLILILTLRIMLMQVYRRGVCFHPSCF